MRKKLAIGSLTVAAVALTATTALADGQPQSGDVVGVGGDTVQYQGDFLAEGGPGTTGYNAAGNVNRIFSFDATADSNGRAAYVSGTATSLNPTVVLRAGLSPVQRPQSSGAAVAALLADNATGTNETINYVRSASPPTGAQQAQATTGSDSAFGGLRTVQIGTETIQIAVANTTNAPTGLSINELKNIYDGAWTTWGDIPGYSGSAGGNTIVAELPPSGSSINKSFLAAIGVGGTGQPALRSDVVTVEQNDPTTITSNAHPADAIVPFSQNRLDLYAAGYFHTPSVVYPGGAVISPNVKLLSAAAPDAAAALGVNISLYIIFRQVDAVSSTPWQPGGTRNWAQELFVPKGGLQPFVNTPAGKADIAAAGGAASYSDLGSTFSVG